jgi:16S rRNA (uracil1498-N3)-methyltransferase
MRINEKVLVCDEEKTYLCSIMNITNTVEVEILETLDDNVEMDINVTVAHGLVRREKMEEVIDYITELGASKYIPVVMTRSIVKVNVDQMNKKNARHSKIAKEAAEQSHRIKIMEVANLETWK